MKFSLFLLFLATLLTIGSSYLIQNVNNVDGLYWTIDPHDPGHRVFLNKTGTQWRILHGPKDTYYIVNYQNLAVTSHGLDKTFSVTHYDSSPSQLFRFLPEFRPLVHLFIQSASNPHPFANAYSEPPHYVYGSFGPISQWMLT